MKKIREKLKASARSRREGTGRVDRQPGIVDGLMQKRKDTKMYAELGRKTVEREAARSEKMPEVPQKNISTKPSDYLDRLMVSNDDRVKGGAFRLTDEVVQEKLTQPEGIRESVQAYNKARKQFNAPKNPTRKPKKPMGRTELGDGGGAGRRIKNDAKGNTSTGMGFGGKPLATGALENRSGDIMTVLGGAGLVGGLMRFAGKFATRAAMKEFYKGTAATAAKTAAKTGTKKAPTAAKTAAKTGTTTKPTSMVIPKPKPFGLPRAGSTPLVRTKSMSKNNPFI